jgi:RNA 2',3'-cyclic 3'-phosphodiesterase
LRLFVALALPEMVRTQLKMLCGGLPGVRWVPPENFHLTLRFIGEVDGGVFHDVDASLAGIRAPRFSLTLSGVGHFGNGRSLRALWAGVAKEPALHHLHGKVESAVVRAGLPAEGKKYTPHIALARPKARPPVNKLQSFLAANNLFRTPPFEVTQFFLYSSFLGSESATYHAEREYELGYA